MDIVAVQKRDLAVKAKKLRRLGFIPCSVFGGTLKESVSVQLDEPTARKMIRMKREGSKLRVNLDGQVIPVQIKEKTINALNNEIVHIGFQMLEADQKVNSVIHIILKNTDLIAGTLEKLLLEIPYASLPADMIDTVTVDMEGMPVGSVLTVADIAELQSDKIELQVDPDSVVLRIRDVKRAITRDTEE